MDEVLSMLVAIAGLCFSIGFMVWSQWRMVKIQAQMLAILADLAQASAALVTDIKSIDGDALQHVEELSSGGWRDLSEDDQLKLKASLLVMLSEMNNPHLSLWMEQARSNKRGEEQA